MLLFEHVCRRIIINKAAAFKEWQFFSLLEVFTNGTC